MIYLSHNRPNIASSVSIVNQFIRDPRLAHLDAVYHILRYLKSCPGKGLMFFNNGHLRMKTYTNADWVGSPDDKRYTSGYCTFVEGNLVSWRNKKQSFVARSSAESQIIEQWLIEHVNSYGL